MESLPIVQVFYSGGQFPKSSAPTQGKVHHEATYKVLITSLSPCMPIFPFSATRSTAAEIAAALASATASNDAADEAFDSLAKDI